jgi:hypothetical protein
MTVVRAPLDSDAARRSCLVPEIVRHQRLSRRTIALLQSAAITQFERLRWAARHLVNRLFERDQRSSWT